ncbi:MAG: AraC family transcriptional regulator [Planctomycetota bacterium]
MLPALEEIPTERGAFYAARRRDAEGFAYAWHFHPEVELTLILGGRGQRFVGDSIVSFGPGDLVLLGPNLPHTWHSRAASDAVVVQFNADRLGGGMLDSPEGAAVGELLRRAGRGLAFPGGGAVLRERTAELPELQGWARVCALLDVLGRLAEAAGVDGGAEVLSDPAHVVPPRDDDRRRIDRVCRLLAERFTGPIAQGEAADAVGLSPASFSRFFRRMTGRTFVAYLHELRIAEACRRLGDPDTPVTDVCFASGFENVSNFNRVFRRLRGESPRAYRRRLAESLEPSGA